MDGKLQNKSGHEPGFLAGLKKSRHAHTLAFMHTHKNAHAPTHICTCKSIHSQACWHPHICIHIYTDMFILSKHTQMSGGVVYTASDDVLPYIPCHSFSWLPFRARVTT